MQAHLYSLAGVVKLVFQVCYIGEDVALLLVVLHERRLRGLPAFPPPKNKIHGHGLSMCSLAHGEEEEECSTRMHCFRQGFIWRRDVACLCHSQSCGEGEEAGGDTPLPIFLLDELIELAKNAFKQAAAQVRCVCVCVRVHTHTQRERRMRSNKPLHTFQTIIQVHS